MSFTEYLIAKTPLAKLIILFYMLWKLCSQYNGITDWCEIRCWCNRLENVLDLCYFSGCILFIFLFHHYLVAFLSLMDTSFLSRIKGTTAVEITSGLHWYLKYWCGGHISWDKTGGIQIASIPNPGSLPRVEDKGVRVQRPVPWNYYQNVVTSSCKYWILYVQLNFLIKNYMWRSSIAKKFFWLWKKY